MRELAEEKRRLEWRVGELQNMVSQLSEKVKANTAVLFEGIKETEKRVVRNRRK